MGICYHRIEKLIITYTKNAQFNRQQLYSIQNAIKLSGIKEHIVQTEMFSLSGNVE